jgi:hypothetical protein
VSRLRSIALLCVSALGCGAGDSVGAAAAQPVAAAALEIVAEDPGCATAGWQHVAYRAQASEAGTLEIEVVDRWPIELDLKTLMGPDDIRYLLAGVAKESVAAGESVSFSWGFAVDPPAAASPDLCPSLAGEHGMAIAAWQDPMMCTRETARVGRSGSSSSLFEASCRSDVGFRPIMARRAGPIHAKRGEWVPLAAWVWASPKSTIEIRESDGVYTVTIDERSISTRDGAYPIWTLRAKLRD